MFHFATQQTNNSATGHTYIRSPPRCGLFLYQLSPFTRERRAAPSDSLDTKKRGIELKLVFVLGTSAEAIKVSPVMHRLAARGVPFEIWSTYQHTEALDKTLASLDLPSPEIVFSRGVKGQPIERPSQMVSWLLHCFSYLIQNRKALQNRLDRTSAIVVHGDTVTTVFGALAGKYLRVPLVHIEAGATSGRLLRPFPEEIDRRVVGKLANLHFAPNPHAAANLKRGIIVNTHRNTAVDGVLEMIETSGPAVLEDPYGLALLHRFEFISKPSFVKETLEVLAAESPVPILVLTDSFSGGPVSDAISSIGGGKLIVHEKLDYPSFIHKMAGATFVVTDSGGLQTESGLLGVPTLIHRQVTESPDGIGENVMLSDWDMGVVRGFLHDYEKLRRPLDVPEISPSDIIVDELITWGRDGFPKNYLD